MKLPYHYHLFFQSIPSIHTSLEKTVLFLCNGNVLRGCWSSASTAVNRVLTQMLHPDTEGWTRGSPPTTFYPGGPSCQRGHTTQHTSPWQDVVHTTSQRSSLFHSRLVLVYYNKLGLREHMAFVSPSPYCYMVFRVKQCYTFYTDDLRVSSLPSWLTRLYHRVDHCYSRLRIGKSLNSNGRTTWREQNSPRSRHE